MRINSNEVILLVIDLQERLFAHISNSELLKTNVPKLIEGFKLFGAPCVLNEQYKKGLGESISEVKSHFSESFEKNSFSSLDDDATRKFIKSSGKKTVVLCGVEAHICILQTALHMLEWDYKVVVVADCVGSRDDKNKELALSRLAQSGAIITSLESILFELCQSSQHENFKAISSLIK